MTGISSGRAGDSFFKWKEWKKVNSAPDGRRRTQLHELASPKSSILSATTLTMTARNWTAQSDNCETASRNTYWLFFWVVPVVSWEGCNWNIGLERQSCLASIQKNILWALQDGQHISLCCCTFAPLLANTHQPTNQFRLEFVTHSALRAAVS